MDSTQSLRLVREIILQLAKCLDENKHCETNEICSLIKKMLADKIEEAKITARWIEDCLPKEYKRKYAKSELTSDLTTREINQTSAGQQIVQEVQGNESIADSHGNNNDELDKKYEADTGVMKNSRSPTRER